MYVPHVLGHSVHALRKKQPISFSEFDLKSTGHCTTKSRLKNNNSDLLYPLTKTTTNKHVLRNASSFNSKDESENEAKPDAIYRNLNKVSHAKTDRPVIATNSRLGHNLSSSLSNIFRRSPSHQFPFIISSYGKPKKLLDREVFQGSFGAKQAIGRRKLI